MLVRLHWLSLIRLSPRLAGAASASRRGMDGGCPEQMLLLEAGDLTLCLARLEPGWAQEPGPRHTRARTYTHACGLGSGPSQVARHAEARR